MSNEAGIIASADTGGSGDGLPDDEAPTGAPEEGKDDVSEASEDDSPDASENEAIAVDDRPPAVLRLERAQRLKREGEIARAEHDAAAVATDQKTARLKALRLEREAADRVVAAKEAATKAELKPAAKRKRVVKATV